MRKLNNEPPFEAAELMKAKLAFTLFALGAIPPKADDIEAMAKFSVLAIELIGELREENAKLMSELALARASKGLAVKEAAESNKEGSEVHREVLRTAADVIDKMSEFVVALEPSSMKTMEMRHVAARTSKMLLSMAGTIK